MTVAFDEGQTTAWLTYLYGEAEGFINIVSTGNWAGKSFQDVDQAVSYIKLLDKRQPKGIYARATTLLTPPPDGQRGGVDHTREVLGLWADLDISGPGHKTTEALPPTLEACLEIIEVSGLPAPTEWIHSGGGMYPWWLLGTPLDLNVPMDPYLKWSGDAASTIDLFAKLSADWQRAIELASRKLGYHYGAGVGDLSRVLRIPGTVNRKVEDAPTLCEWRTELSLSSPYEAGELAASLHAAMHRLDVKPVAVQGFTPPVASTPGNRPGDAFNAATTWHQLLEADGAVVFKDTGTGYIQWTRPGKDRRDGPSGTTGYKGSDVLKVLSDLWTPLRQGQTYDRFGYYATTQHGGNIKEAAKALASRGYGEQRQAAQREAASQRTEAGAVYWDYEPDEPVADITATFDAGTKGTTVRPPSVKPTYSYTDSGIADRMQARYGDDWRYVATRQRFGWLRWNGKTWESDKRGAVTNLVDQLVQEEYAKAAEQEFEDPKAAEKLRAAIKPMLSNSKQLGATATFSRRWQIAIEADELDFHRKKITCDNGIFDLDAMTFGNHDRSLLATKKLGVAYDKAATAPKWEKFLEDVLPDPSMRDYLQRAIGYTLLGDPTRKAIFMLHGPSHTGKSQVINVLSAVFGGFAESAKEQTFRVNDAANGPTPGLHKLRGARLVTASESTEGVRLDEALIKQLTGGDTISSRPLYGDEESWQPQFSIWLATNHLPKFNSDDNAIWRRVKPIRFGVEFGKDGREEVFDIGRLLVAEEGPGILNWILAGVIAYRDRGLEEPEALQDGVSSYRSESDVVSQFIAHHVLEGALLPEADGAIETRILYAMFTAWCADEGIRYPLSSNRFGRRMTVLGYEAGRDAAGTRRTWTGLRGVGNTWRGSGRPLRE